MFKKFFETINSEIQKTLKGEQIKQQCNNCGAAVEGTTRDETITCQYCGMSQKNNFYKPVVDVDNNKDIDIDEPVNYGGGFNRAPHFHRGMHGDGVYAWVIKGGLFYEGDVPGVNFCRVSLCDSFEECVSKLKQKFYERKNSALYEPPKQNLDEIRRQKPNARIIRID